MIVVNMQDKSDGSKRTKEYFVPYLSIYPKSYIDTLTNTDQKNKPLFEAELALLVDIGVDEIDSLEFKYDKSIFDLDKVKLQDTKRTAAGKQFSMDKTIKITCKKEIPDLSSGEISVYAYPKDSKGKPAAEREAMRSLAGKIQVLPNGKEQRKKQKFVLICVKTQQGEGIFNKDEIITLQHTLHQALVEAEIEQYQKDKKGEIKLDKDGRPQRIGLDLTNDSNFYKTYVKVEGIINEDKNHGKMFSYLRGTFLKINPQYNNYFTVFVFNNKTYDGAVGQIEKMA